MAIRWGEFFKTGAPEVKEIMSLVLCRGDSWETVGMGLNFGIAVRQFSLSCTDMIEIEGILLNIELVCFQS